MSNEFNCKTKGVVYMTECQKCGIQYVGQTARNFGKRVGEHVNDIKTIKTQQMANTTTLRAIS